MSDRDDNHSTKKTHGTHTIRASKGGGGGKWLIAAGAAAVILGGGYFAYQSMTPSANTQAAYNDQYDDPYGSDPLRAGPIDREEEPLAEGAALDDSANAPAPAARRASTPARASTTPRRTTVAEADVPEETIGVMPVNATVSDSEEIIVNPPRRPVWTRTPNARRLSAFYPESDLNRGREGEARLSCTVADGGALDCARASETSAGFGRAALRVARTYRHSTTLADGSDATGTPVNLRVLFRLADEDRRSRG